MVERWLEANRRAQEAGDWRGMAELFTVDATYGWNMGPREEFMAVGSDEIREIALGMEMGGLDGWTYPYQKVLIDEHQGEVIGLWKQVADAKRPDGSAYEVAGLGGSWFRYAGNWQWSWQTRLLRLRQRHRPVHRDDACRRPLRRHAAKARPIACVTERFPATTRSAPAPAGLWD